MIYCKKKVYFKQYTFFYEKMFRWFVFISSVLIIFWTLELIFWDDIRWSKDQRIMQNAFNLVYYWTLNFWDNFESWLKITKSKIDQIRWVAHETQQKIETVKSTYENAKKVINTVNDVKNVLESTWTSLWDSINKVVEIMDIMSNTGKTQDNSTGNIQNFSTGNILNVN